MTQTRRTPCVGICSTTYGDLVCRGCKRFAHEIVQWNGYAAEQQQQVWYRLQHLRDEVTEMCVSITDPGLYEQQVEHSDLGHLEPNEQRYEVVRHLAIKNLDLASAGLQTSDQNQDALATLQAIDAEIYRRSIAHYERNFKIPL